jgi:hypothetical protein
MEAREVAHIVQGPVEMQAASPASEAEQEVDRLQQAESFRRHVALWVSIVAVVLAITTMAREQATNTLVNANIQVSDTYNFFQAKNIRQTDNQIAADELETLIFVLQPDEPLRSRMQERLARYQANVERYESEPETGEGKQELLARARTLERSSEDARTRQHSLHYSEALLQIAIVLGSVAILSLSRPVLFASGGATGLAVLLLLNGLVTRFHLPV